MKLIELRWMIFKRFDCAKTVTKKLTSWPERLAQQVHVHRRLCLYTFGILFTNKELILVQIQLRLVHICYGVKMHLKPLLLWYKMHLEKYVMI